MAEIDKYEAMEVLTKKQEEERARLIKAKKRNYRIGFISLGVAALGLAAIYILASNVWLIDLDNMPYIEYEYKANQTGEKTATLRRVKNESSYPEKFRIPAYVNGYRINAIGNNAFAGCERIKSVVMTDAIESIGEYAFAGLEKLESVTFSKNITYMGTGAFDNTKFLNTLPEDKVTLICGILFKVGDGILDQQCIILNDHDSTVPSGYESLKKVYFSDWSNGEEIKVWSDGLFYNNKNIVYVELPTYLTNISINTFNGASNLRGVKLPEDVESFTIQDYAFFNCGSLVDIELNDKVSTIGNYAFGGTALDSINLPDTISEIGEGAFAYCENLVSIDWPSNGTGEVLSIPNEIFYGCSSLQEVNLDEYALESITYVGKSAFAGTKISSFVFPKHVSAISEKIFEDDADLETIGIYEGKTYFDKLGDLVVDGVTKISPSSFQNTGLSTVYLYDDNYDRVTDLGEINLPATLNMKAFTERSSAGNQFSDNLNITKFTFPYTVQESSWEMFAGDRNLSSVVFETYRDGYTLKGLKVLSYRTFYQCESLTSVDLPQTLEEIKQGAFEESGLTSVTFKENEKLYTISENAFKNCENLTSVKLNSTINNIKTGAFENDTNLEYIYIPFRDEERIAGGQPSNLTIQVNTFVNMREKNEQGEFTSTMPIYLNVTKDETKNTNMPDSDTKCWHDDSVTIYWKGEWELDEYGVPHAL